MADQRSAETVAAAYGVAADRSFGAVSPPLYLSTAFALEGFERPDAPRGEHLNGAAYRKSAT